MVHPFNGRQPEVQGNIHANEQIGKCVEARTQMQHDAAVDVRRKGRGGENPLVQVAALGFDATPSSLGWAGPGWLTGTLAFSSSSFSLPALSARPLCPPPTLLSWSVVPCLPFLLFIYLFIFLFPSPPCLFLFAGKVQIRRRLTG